MFDVNMSCQVLKKYKLGLDFEAACERYYPFLSLYISGG